MEDNLAGLPFPPATKINDAVIDIELKNAGIDPNTANRAGYLTGYDRGWGMAGKAVKNAEYRIKNGGK